MKGMIESFELLRGVPVARWAVVTKYGDLEKFDFPFFLKVNLGEHKTEIGGVLKCNNLDEARAGLLKLHKTFPREKIIVQEAVEGIEMIVGLKEDRVFGKLLVVGFGGIFAEVRKDVSFRALPVSRKDIGEMVHGLKGSEIFVARGKSYALEKFYTLIEKISHIGEKKEISEMDLNPVIVGEKEVAIVDARIS
jgi:hypothetical protein